MERLLYEGTPADSRDSRGRTPLMLATLHGYLSVVKLLVERDDVDVNAQTDPPYSLTSLILAAERVNPRVIQVLLKGGADANTRSYHGTALNCAVNIRDIIGIGLLLEAGADPDTPDKFGTPVVFDAVQPSVFNSISQTMKINNLETEEEARFVVLSLKLFHRYGANIMAKDTSQRTLLHIAVQESNHAAVQMLLDEGLDPNAIDNIGQSPLHKIEGFSPERFGTQQIFERPLAHSAQHMIVRSLCEQGSRLDTVDRKGNTLMHIGAASGCTFDAFELLLDKSVRIHAVNKMGCTPLLVTVSSCFPTGLAKEKARLLLNRGADLQDTDIDGASVVHWATSSLEMLRFLVEESGAEVNVKTYDDSTPLHWALKTIGSARLEVARYLIDRDVDPEARNIYGRTAFEDPDSGMGEAELREILMEPYREERPQSPL